MPKYTVQHTDGRFPWVVVDEHGEVALHQPHPQVGEVPMGFRTQALAQTAADQLNADAQGEESA